MSSSQNLREQKYPLGIAYQDNGQTTQAVEPLENVVRVEEKLAEDYPDRLASQHVLASVYWSNGQITEAVATLEHVVKVQEKLAEDHPSRLALLQHELTRGNLSATSRLLSRAYGRPAQVIAARAAERAG
jgi:tetratricopeptide (TPR) repeat protein